MIAKYLKPLNLLAFLGTLGLIISLVNFWVPVKAQLAQYLLESSWDYYQQTGKNRKPWPWADHQTVAQIQVPRLGLKQIVLAGDSGRSLAFAPGVNERTDINESAMVISGHRDTHFRFLEHLTVNDSIFLILSSGQREFKVVGFEIIDSQKSKLNPQRFHNGLILVTCYPFDAVAARGPLRYVVFARSVQNNLYAD